MSSQDNIVLVFDTETTGLIQNNVTHIDQCPRITQMSFILYNASTHTVIEEYNKYIIQPESTDFSSKAFQITNITKEMCDGGVTIKEAINHFYFAYIRAKEIIAHNIEFDRKMIQIEVLRQTFNGVNAHHTIMFNEMYNIIENKKTYCTMQMGKDVTNIIITGKYGPFKKSPKLSELHEKLFDSVPENLHDSAVDTLACLKCYLKIKYNHNL